MMGQFMLGLVNTSAVTGVSIAAAGILLRATRKSYSARCRKRIWILLAFCLLIQFRMFHFSGIYTIGIPNPVLRESDSRGEEPPADGAPQSAQGQFAQSGPGENKAGENQMEKSTARGGFGGDVSGMELTAADVLFLVWACGCAVLGVYYGAGYRKLQGRIRRWSSECEDPHVRELLAETAAECGLKKVPGLRIMKDSAEGPFTTGVRESVILLPEDALPERDLRLILKHEVIHCRNHDIIWRLFFLTVNVVHWFNPLVWYLRRAAEQDMEIACDEEIVSMATGEDRKEYSDVILSWVEKSSSRGSVVSTGCVSGVKFLKRRFDAIFSGKKKRNGILLAGGICIFALFVGCVIQLQGNKLYGKNKIAIDRGYEVRTDVDGDGEMDRVHVSDNNPAGWDSVETCVSVNLSSGREVQISYPDYWTSYLVTGDLSGNGAADIVLVKIARGSTHYTGDIAVLHVQTDEAGMPELVEYPSSFIQNPTLEPTWAGNWEDYAGDKSNFARQPADFDPRKWFSCMGAAIIEKDGKTLLRMIEFLDGWTESARCIDCSYTAEGWYIEDMQIIYGYGGSEWEAVLLGNAGEAEPGAPGIGVPEPVSVRCFTEAEAEVTPRIEQYDFYTALERGTLLQQIRGDLPGASEGVWYTVLTEGVEYYYGAYDHAPDQIELFGYAIVGGTYSLANGIVVGMTKEELLERWPDMRMEDMEGTVLNGVTGHMGWNSTAYPRSRKGMDEALDYGAAEYYKWDSRFDYIMLADIEQEPDTLPLSVALMMKDDVVAAITFYCPTAG